MGEEVGYRWRREGLGGHVDMGSKQVGGATSRHQELAEDDVFLGGNQGEGIRRHTHTSPHTHTHTQYALAH